MFSRTLSIPLMMIVFLLPALPLAAQADVHECSAPGTPFGNAPTTISDTITVSHAVTIADLQAFVDVSHAWVGDVQCDLASPLGTTVRLHDGGGGNARDLRVLFSDSGIGNGTAPYSFGCAMQPSGPGTMAAFDGESTAGDWTLTLNDTYPALDDGALDSWCLQAFAAVPNPAPPAALAVSCAAQDNGGSQEIVVSWDPMLTFDSVLVSVEGAIASTVPTTTATVTVPVAATSGLVEVCIEGIVTGSAPSCRTCCSVQLSPVTSAEECSTPGLAFGGAAGTPATISDTITWTGTTPVGDVAVGVDIDHAWVADVLLDVISPTGTTVRLHNGQGGQATDLKGTYSELGVPNGSILYDVPCPMQPSGPGALSDFFGETPTGDWELAIEDNYPIADNGMLNNWCLTIYDTTPGSAPPPITNLLCAQSSIPGAIELTWTNGAPYDQILISADGVPLATVPGSETSYLTAPFADGTLIEFTVRGSSAGSIPSCSAFCAAEASFGYQLFVRGDANADASVNISDAVSILTYLFGDNVLTCHDAADVNDDETLNVADPVFLLAYLFSAGTEPPAPVDECGADPTADTTLTCQSYEPCLGFTDETLARHVLRRVAYGPTLADIDYVLTVGVDAYIEEQLNPDAIDESGNTALNSQLALLNVAAHHNELSRMQMVRGIYSQKQLQEQLTDFWENHFSTYMWTAYNYFVAQSQPMAYEQTVGAELVENTRFRDNSLGNFEDLLTASATSVSMLIYLDSVVNVVGNANENYARELLELHSMGVDNGYTQDDIVELSRVFTGWTVCKVAPANVGNPHAPCLPNSDPNGVWDFHFEPGDHDYTQKTLFPNTAYTLIIPDGIPGSTDGVDEGFLVIQHLAQLPQTAEFVSRKLVQKFVADSAPLSLVASCIATWTTTGGDLEEVVRTILTSQEFLGTAHRWDKLRTAQEHALASLRAFEATTNGTPVLQMLSAVQNLPFHRFTPDGYQEDGLEQLGTSRVLERIRFHDFLYTTTNNPQADVVGLLNAEAVPLDDPSAIANFFWTLIAGSNYSATDVQLALDMLNTDLFGNPSPLDPMAADYAERVGLCAALVASSPQAMRQ